jgi:hypothetical protein
MMCKWFFFVNFGQWHAVTISALAVGKYLWNGEACAVIETVCNNDNQITAA